MSLRRRLVASQLVALVIGLTLTSTLVYKLYSDSLLGQIDKQLTSALPVIEHRLDAPLRQGGPPPVGGRAFPFSGPPNQRRALPSDSIAELVNPTTLAVEPIPLFGNTSISPQFPNLIFPVGGSIGFLSRSTTQGGSYRIALFQNQNQNQNSYTLLAIPLGSTQQQLQVLLLTEVASGIALAALAAVIILVTLRRGLKPLEEIARTADEIAAGDISLRLASDGNNSETAKVEKALNSMLNRIEEAFHERDEIERTLRQFLADASHELRTPLTSIVGFAELFQLGAKDRPEDVDTLMARIVNESHRMTTLVESLLLLARLDAKRESQRSPLDLSVILSEAVESIAVVNPDRRFSFSTESPGFMLGDEAHLHQAITNLLSNAVKHTPAGTPIEVSLVVEPSTNTCTLTVADHGMGLSEEAMVHIFDRFWQQDQSRGVPGSGLGLSIVKAVALEHGGSVTARNRSDTAGAAFIMELPGAPSGG